MKFIPIVIKREFVPVSQIQLIKILITSMSRLEQEERVSIVRWFYESQGSVITTQRKYRHCYNKRKAPSRNTIKDLIKKV